MIERLIRLGLALAVAFVFTGRMEAATAHCARLVAEEQAVVEPRDVAEPGAMPCHGMDEAAPASEPASSDQPAQHHPAKHSPVQGKCECVAVLAGFTSFAPWVASAHIEPYEWMRPQGAAFLSIESSPGLRPPRA
ncbi:MAG TPA: hypothetical protein VFV70_07030 [Hyphomonadaceae bacterium]|nr:hypothetical protein [Hyphomonadaceae bacterium]